ncbi:MAG: hypothetical protein ACLPSH_11570 [Vulcanimicrobiaceae bacterium]
MIPSHNKLAAVRLVHHAVIFELTGESYRLRSRKKGSTRASGK